LARFEFESGTFWWFYYLYLVSCEESCLLVSWCAGGRCGMVGSDEDRGRSRKPSVEDQAWSHRSGIQWPGDRKVE
jgi:hypothetical protein